MRYMTKQRTFFAFARNAAMTKRKVRLTRALSLYVVCSMLSFQPLAHATTTADVNQPIASPVFVNLYWDTTWDTDNPGLKQATLDEITRTIINSSYFTGLAEYGVTSASFGGSFLPDPACPSKAPNSVGFYDPVNTSIAGFIQCEHDNGPAILRQNSVIYNVILPPSSVESDFWSSNFCKGSGSPMAWHYHGLEDNVLPFSGSPVYTIVQSAEQCGGDPGLVSSLTHEMLEATTDPSPIDISIIPPEIDIETQNEIADICEGNDKPIFVDSNGQTPLFMPVTVASYWSNKSQKCLAFSDTTAPVVNNVAVSNWGSQTQLTVSGTGFGTMPAQLSLPSSTLPYLELADSAHGWAAGESINGDSTALSIGVWSATQVPDVGFIPPAGESVNNNPGAPLVTWLCNPNSLQCISHAAVAAPGPYNPRLTVYNTISGDFVGAPDEVTVLMNGAPIMTNTVSSTCSSGCGFSSVQTVTPGTYAFTQTITGSSAITTASNSCSHVSLSLGEETSCLISDDGPTNSSGGCPSGTKCCEPGNGKCAKCQPEKTACD